MKRAWILEWSNSSHLLLRHNERNAKNEFTSNPTQSWLVQGQGPELLRPPSWFPEAMFGETIVLSISQVQI
jgi:hypothetical protein